MKNFIMLFCVGIGIILFQDHLLACSVDFSGSPSDDDKTYATFTNVTFTPTISEGCAIKKMTWSIDGHETLSASELRPLLQMFQKTGDYTIQLQIENREGILFHRVHVIRVNDTYEVRFTPSEGCNVYGPFGELGTGILCGSEDSASFCRERYNNRVGIIIKCLPKPGYVHTSWTVNNKVVGDPFPSYLSASNLAVHWEENENAANGTCEESSPDCYILSVTKSGTGAGTVRGDSINCGYDCTGRYTAGTNLTLHAVADSRSQFARWLVNGRETTLFSPVKENVTVIAVFDTRQNRPPRIFTQPDQHRTKNYAYHVAAKDPDGDRLTYRLSQFPEGMTIDETFGNIAWEPREDQIGRHTVVVVVDDGRGGIERQVFTLHITKETFTSAAIGFLQGFEPSAGKMIDDDSLLVMAKGGVSPLNEVLLPKLPEGAPIFTYDAAVGFYFLLKRTKQGSILFHPNSSVEYSVLENIPYDNVNDAAVKQYAFTIEDAGIPVDENDTVMIHMSDGAYFKIGHFTEEADFTVRFDYMKLQSSDVKENR